MCCWDPNDPLGAFRTLSSGLTAPLHAAQSLTTLSWVPIDRTRIKRCSTPSEQRDETPVSRFLDEQSRTFTRKVRRGHMVLWQQQDAASMRQDSGSVVSPVRARKVPRCTSNVRHACAGFRIRNVCCVQSSITHNVAVHVPVLWPVCAHTI